MNSTGPRTDSGKAASSRNATKTGLFAVRDYILPGENEEYDRVLASLFQHLKPQGILEEIHAAEIMTATWRLRRCAALEAGFATADLSPEDLAKQQKSIDRARAQAHNVLRRSTAELRKLQTEGAIRAELGSRGFDIENFPGLTDSRQLLNTIHSWEKRNPAPAAAQTPSFEDLFAAADQSLGMRSTQETSFCNPTLRSPLHPLNTPNSAARNTLFADLGGPSAH